MQIVANKLYNGYLSTSFCASVVITSGAKFGITLLVQAKIVDEALCGGLLHCLYRTCTLSDLRLTEHACRDPSVRPLHHLQHVLASECIGYRHEISLCSFRLQLSDYGRITQPELSKGSYPATLAVSGQQPSLARETPTLAFTVLDSGERSVSESCRCSAARFSWLG